MGFDEIKRLYPRQSDAWCEGFRNGRADRLLGFGITVAIWPDGSTYSQEYSRGYRAGQLP